MNRTAREIIQLESANVWNEIHNKILRSAIHIFAVVGVISLILEYINR